MRPVATRSSSGSAGRQADAAAGPPVQAPPEPRLVAASSGAERFTLISRGPTTAGPVAATKAGSAASTWLITTGSSSPLRLIWRATGRESDRLEEGNQYPLLQRLAETAVAGEVLPHLAAHRRVHQPETGAPRGGQPPGHPHLREQGSECEAIRYDAGTALTSSPARAARALASASRSFTAETPHRRSGRSWPGGEGWRRSGRPRPPSGRPAPPCPPWWQKRSRARQSRRSWAKPSAARRLKRASSPARHTGVSSR